MTFHSPFSCCPVLYDFQLRRCVLQTFLDFDSTERLLDAVVPFIALHPRIESMWRHEVHIGGGKDSTFRRNFCVLQFSFAGYLTDIQISCFARRAMRLHLVLTRTRNFPAIPSAKMPRFSRLLRLVEETWHHSLKPHGNSSKLMRSRSVFARKREKV